MSTDRSDPSLDYTLPFQLTKTIHRKVPDELQPEKEENRNAAKGKIVVITGGGSGIGAATARVWVRAGAEGVVISGRRKEKLDETIAALEQLNTGATRTLAVVTDVMKEADTEHLFASVKETFGRAADVVFANAGILPANLPLAEENVRTWWSTLEVNVLGVHNTVVSWIRSQPDSKQPTGTIINVNSAMAGVTIPGNSAYSVSKIAAHKYMEYVAADYPTLRPFTLLPGIVSSEINTDIPEILLYAKDEAEQTGALGLYLASPRADWLVNSLVSINWDLPEMEAHNDAIQSGLLRNNWVSVLPAGGGKGLWL